MLVSVPLVVPRPARTLLSVVARGTPWAVAVAALAVLAVSVLHAAAKPDWLDGRDFVLYREATERWLAGGAFYEPYQVAGPYSVTHGDVLYPPIALLLFVPSTLLPAFLFWVVPLGVIAWVVVSLRPSPTGWLLIALCMAWPVTVVKVSTGNPVLWIAAAVALGVKWSWPAVLVLVKPTLAPFAVIGLRRRSWWLALATLGALSVPFGALWLEWLSAVTNARGGGLLYSVLELPLLAVPVIADLTRTLARRPERTRTMARGRLPAWGLSPRLARATVRSGPSPVASGRGARFR